MNKRAKENLVVIHGGGPTAVLNSTLYGIILEALRSSKIQNIYGAVHGIKGILSKEFWNLGKQTRNVIKGLLNTPGSAIGSSRYRLEENDYGEILNVVKEYNIKYFLFNGGNDTMGNAFKFWSHTKQSGSEVRIIGIPKTVDNDLEYTDHCPGYGSAAMYIASAVRYLDMDNRSLPTPVTILETMGRNAGWLAASSCVAKQQEEDGPHLIYVPERPFEKDAFLKDVEDVFSKYKRAVIVVSEGIKDKNGAPVYESESAADTDEFGHILPGSVSQILANLISRKLKIRSRSEKPGLLGRAWSSLISKVDQEEAIRSGKEAVQHIIKGEDGIMLTLIGDSDKPYHCSIGTVELGKAAGVQKCLPKHFISDKGNHITEDFRSYVEPLIGEDLPRFIKFVKN